MRLFDHVPVVWAESCVVGCMDWCRLTTVIQPGLGCALAAPSMSRMTSLTKTLFVNVVSTLGFVLSFTVTGNTIYSSLFVNVCDLVSRTFAWPVGPLHTHWRIILSHNLVTEIQRMLTRNKVGTNCFYSKCVVENSYLAIYSSDDAEAVTMSSSESNFYIVLT